MPTRRVDIKIWDPYKSRLSRVWLRRVAKCVLQKVLPGESCQISLVIADDDTVRELNHRYRGLDEVTDVLSFSTSHQGHWEGEEEPPTEVDLDPVSFPLPPGEPLHLGEVVISYPQAGRQSGSGTLDLENELAMLVVHGVLHLVGLDHVEPEEEAHMMGKQREILSGLAGVGGK